MINSPFDQEARNAEVLLREFASSSRLGAHESRIVLALASDIQLLLEDMESFGAAPRPPRPVPKVFKQFIMSALAQLVEIVCANQPARRYS